MFVPILDFPDYSVSASGKVFSSKTDKILKPSLDNWGYPVVSLSNGEKKRTAKVHLLVAEAFIGPKPQGLQVNHKDGDKTNNHVDNLEYVTPSENSLHAVRLGLTPKTYPSRQRLSSDQVEVIRALKGQKLQREVAEIFGVSREHVRDIQNGKKRRYG